MTTIYLVRHAEAEGNLYRRIHGWYDSLITENGYRQIAALEERFRDIPVDAVYSSDLFRTMTTARAVYVPKGLELHTDPGLRELSLGEWEDRTFGSVRHTNPHQMDLFNRTDPAWEVENAESFFQLGDRVYDTVRRLVEEHPNQTIALFSHGMALRQFLGKVKNVPPEEWHSMPHGDNTAVSCLTWDGDTFEIQFEMDNSHLPEDISTLARQAWWRKDKKAAADVNLWYDCGDRGSCAAVLGEALPEQGKGILAFAGDRHAGLLWLEPERSTEAGYISLCYVLPEHRGRGLGIQLIGEAVSRYRGAGRDRLCLHCSPDNEGIRRFFLKYGFKKIGEGPEGDLLEKYIGYER
ncbi:MAG: GNAT family N-acetyltransferase [Lawsonibacter sp.]|nr:GNAT family N-acetyltransferase [Lawsonibacter sp.]